MAQRRALERLLNAYARHGWKDHDGSSADIVESLAKGESPGRAALHASRDMLSGNRIARSDLTEVLQGFLESERSVLSDDVADGEHQPTADVVVLTAIQSEFDAVKDCLEADPRRRTSPHGTVYYVGQARGSFLTLAVTEIGPGNLGAATEAAAAITEFNPRLLLFVGIAGGLKDDVGIGDVIVATIVHYYEPGKGTGDGFQARPLPLRTGHRLEQLVRDVARDFDAAAVLVKPIAAGEQLVAASNAAVAQTIKEHYNDAVAVDMESGGLYEVAHRMEVPCLSIRGVSDCLDAKTGAADAANQPLAARRAAGFMALLLRSDRILEVI